MTEDNKPALPFPIHLVYVETIGVVIAAYFFMGASDPAGLAEMGIPVLIPGEMGFVAGIASMLLGGFPLIRWLIENKRG